VDVANLDFHLTATAAARNAAGPLEPGAPVLDRQYVVHQGSESRPSDGVPDMGAFEYGSAVPVDPLPPTTVDAAPPVPVVDARPAAQDSASKSDAAATDSRVVRLDAGAVDARATDARGSISGDAGARPGQMSTDAGTPTAVATTSASGCSSFPTGPATGSAGWLSACGLLLVFGLRRRR
jgi:hypothetical protein